MSGIDEASVAGWRAAIGREAVQEARLDRGALTRFALAVGGAAVGEGAVGGGAGAMPPLAHWAFFLPGPTDDELGPDGHPRRGGFLPDVTLPRRMFAGAQMTFEAALEIDAPARLETRVADVRHKGGRSGDLVFVEVDRVLAQDGVVRVRERQTYVYRGEGAAVALPVPAANAPEGERWMPDEVNLFRFSAATFNAHRIHYDRPYATAVEGYPALVIHGPFTAARLAGLAMRQGELATFSFRAEAPLFLGQPVFLQADGAEMRAVRCDGAVAMRASATWRRGA